MLGYLYILITVFFNVSKGGCAKVVSSKLDCVAECINLTFAKNFVCVVIGFFILVFSGSDLSMPMVGWLICLLSGIGMAVNYLMWLITLKSGAYMLTNTVNNVSFVIVAVCGVVLFKETISAAKLVSFLLVIISVYFMLRYQAKEFVKPNFKTIVLLACVFVLAGTISVSQKLFTTYVKGLSVNHFTFYTFVVSLAVLAVCRIFVKSPKSVRAQAGQIAKFIPHTFYMGATLYGATFFQTEATKYLSSIVIYPLSSSLELLGASIMAWLCFRERPSKDSVIGGIAVLGALILSRF